MSALVTYARQGRIGVLIIDNPPVNAFSQAVRDALDERLQEAIADPATMAIVLAAAGRTFVAGADIREFGSITSGQLARRSAHPLLNGIENSPTPIVAALHGTALGGGLELAMAAHYRVAVPSAQMGQPEVKLGLIPGAGGTQRLPRLVGPILAAEMCAFGEPIDAFTALAQGLVDAIIDGDLHTGALAFAESIVGRPVRRVRDRLEKLRAVPPDSFTSLRAATRTRMRGQTAPLAAINAVEAAVTLPFDEGCRREYEIFEHCLRSDQSAALIHVFFAERGVAKVPALADAPRLPVRRAAVVGAGTMGTGIAMAYANAGLPVLLNDVSDAALERGLATIRGHYATSRSKGRLTEEDMTRRLALITPAPDYEALATADIVVEAAFEEMNVKKIIFAELDRVTRRDAILATNTSYLDIDEIAAATSRPEMVVGHHFFSPAHVMRLLEIVRGRATAPTVLATSMDLARTLRKIGVLVGNGRGFVGNRMYEPYVRESVSLVEEGTPPWVIDDAMYAFGMAMGPLAVQDLAGLDIGWRTRKAFAHLRLPGVRYPFAHDLLCEMGRFGQKTGAGWYRYEGARSRRNDPDVLAAIRARALADGIEQREATPEEIVDRLVLALVNEGARVLEDGIALRAADIDVVYVHGYGFPAWRGGPMMYADQRGLGRVAEKVRALQTRHGDLWRPAALVERLAREEGSFAAFDRTIDSAARR
jgi:3-hydroxyacyl-CoA dehydrogenase